MGNQSVDIPVASSSGGSATSGSKVTSAVNIALLADNANWSITNQYTGTAIAGQSTGDWYDDGSFRYKFITATTVSRIPYANL